MDFNPQSISRWQSLSLSTELHWQNLAMATVALPEVMVAHLEDMVALTVGMVALLEGMGALLGGMEATEAMEVMGMARGQQIPAMVTVDTEATEAMAMGVIAGVMAAMATMAEANQIQMMMSRILRENQGNIFLIWRLTMPTLLHVCSKKRLPMKV